MFNHQEINRSKGGTGEEFVLLRKTGWTLKNSHGGRGKIPEKLRAKRGPLLD